MCWWGSFSSMMFGAAAVAWGMHVFACCVMKGGCAHHINCLTLNAFKITTLLYNLCRVPSHSLVCCQPAEWSFLHSL